MSWSPDGKEIVWTVGNHVYRRPLDSIEFREDEIDDEPSEEDEAGGDGKAEGDEEEPLLEEDEEVAADRIEIYLPRYAPDGVIALVNGTVITMADGRVIDDGVVLVENDRIVEVGSSSDVAVPDAAHVVDIRGRFVVPALSTRMPTSGSRVRCPWGRTGRSSQISHTA